MLWKSPCPLPWNQTASGREGGRLNRLAESGTRGGCSEAGGRPGCSSLGRAVSRRRFPLAEEARCDLPPRIRRAFAAASAGQGLSAAALLGSLAPRWARGLGARAAPPGPGDPHPPPAGRGRTRTSGGWRAASITARWPRACCAQHRPHLPARVWSAWMLVGDPVCKRVRP